MIGSLVLGASGGLLGCFAVLRKQGLLGDALAHAALPGIAMAFILMQTKVLSGLLLGALISGLFGAFLIHFLVTKTKIKMDTAMASILSVFFGLGILLLTYIQRLPLASQSGLDTFLFGQAAALLREDVLWMGGAFLVILFLVTAFWKELKLFTFDSTFGLVVGFKRGVLDSLFMLIFVTAILMSLQAVGVVLTAALFITPAASALLLTNRLFVAVILSTVFGMISGGAGAYASMILPKMPTGPVIVIATTFIFVVCFLFAPRRGVISRWVAHRRYSLKVQIENILGRFYRDIERGYDSWKVEDFKNFGYREAILNKLVKFGFANISEGVINLTKSGVERAKSVIEKHRLWETYLVNRMNVAPDHVHRDAEEIEHVLTDEMKNKLKKLLKHPKEDPHGRPIK